MSKALESALQAVQRMRGESDVSTVELLTIPATALKTLADRAGETEENDRDGRPH